MESKTALQSEESCRAAHLVGKQGFVCSVRCLCQSCAALTVFVHRLNSGRFYTRSLCGSCRSFTVEVDGVTIVVEKGDFCAFESIETISDCCFEFESSV